MAGESLAHLQTAVAMHGKSPEQDQGLQPERCTGLSLEEDHYLLRRAQPQYSGMGGSGHTHSVCESLHVSTPFACLCEYICLQAHV